jgi:competence protein ComEC
MLYSALAILAGISVFLTLMPTTGWPLAAPLLLLLATPRRSLRFSGLAVAGFLWCGWHLDQALAQELPRSLENRDVQVEGVIQGLPERLTDGRLRFRFEIDCYHEETGCRALPLTVRLNWYRHAPALHPGERWQLRVRLKRPHGFANPGGFDYERWLLAAGIRATGYVRGKGNNRRIGGSPGYSVQAAREWLAKQLVQQLGSNPQTSLLRALGVGDRCQLAPPQWEVLRATGTSHLLAISGLHVGLVASLIFVLARHIWGRAGLCRYWPARYAAALASIAAALGYALLSGFQVPAQRALIMITVFMLSGFASQRLPPWHIWSQALLLVLLIDPLSALTPGFWLSFGAVAAILYLSVGYHGDVPKWYSIGRLQLLLPIALLPPGWIWFQQVSVVAPLANLLAIPWVGFLVVPPLLAGLACLPVWSSASGWLLAMAAVSVQLLWRGLEWFAGWRGNLLHLPAITAQGLLWVVLGMVCVLACRVLPVRLTGILLLVAVALAPSPRPATGNVWMTVLDVGQGLSAVIQTHRRLLVFDTGPAFRSGFNTGEAVVTPYLRWLGYNFIDRLVISHSDNDHAGGAAALLSVFNAGTVSSGEPGELNLSEVRACRAGQRWVWDTVQFEMLSPADDNETGNNASCVLRITARDGRSILLPGDIERRVERRLLQQVTEQLPATVLLAPHHGSLTSSSIGFISAVNAELVVFSTGYLNRFGFPKVNVVQRYQSLDTALLNTAEEGSIRIRLDAGRPLAVSRYRQLQRFGALPAHIPAP